VAKRVKPLPPKPLHVSKRQSSSMNGNDFPERPEPAHGRCGQSELVRRIRDLREELNWYYHRIELEQLRPEESSSKRLHQLQEKAVSTRTSFCERCGNCLRTNAKRHPRSSRGLLAGRLRPLCPWTRALVEYYSSGDRLIAAVVTRETIKITPSASSPGSSTFFTCFVFSFRNFAWEPLTLTAFEQPLLSATQSHLEALYAELIAPIREHLNASNLIFVPTALCTFFPSMLCDMAMNTSATRTRFPMPSATVLPFARKKRATTWPTPWSWESRRTRPAHPE